MRKELWLSVALTGVLGFVALQFAPSPRGYGMIALIGGVTAFVTAVITRKIFDA